MSLLYLPSEQCETGGYTVFTFDCLSVCLSVCVCVRITQTSLQNWRIYALVEAVQTAILPSYLYTSESMNKILELPKWHSHYKDHRGH